MSDNKLNNVEFLAVKMLTHPGMSGRWYREQLYRYRYPGAWRRRKGTSRVSDHYSEYFRRRGKYRGKLWEDRAPKVFHDPMPWLNEYRRGTPRELLKPRRSEWHLTPAGVRYAERARRKLGLPPFDETVIAAPSGIDKHVF